MTVSGVQPIHIQKFGTQGAKAKQIMLYQNGDRNHAGSQLTMVKGITTMDKLMVEMTKKLTLTTGAAKRAYLIGGRENGTAAGITLSQVTSLDGFEDQGDYLVCGPEKVDRPKMPTILYQPQEH